MANVKRTGNIDARRITIDAIPGWPEVPAVLVPGNMDVYGIYDDFFKECNLAAGRTLNGWRLRVTGGAWTMADEPGGVGLMQTGAVNDQLAQVTLGGDATGAFLPAAHHDIYYEVRTKIDTVGAGTANVGFGLINPAAADYYQAAGAGIAQTDYICWETIDDAVDTWSFTSASAAGGVDRNDIEIDLESLTFRTFGFWVRGLDAIYPFFDRVYYPAGLIATANIPLVNLMPFFAVRSGDGTNEPLYFDYCMCIQER